MVSPNLVCQWSNLGLWLAKIVGHGSLNMIYLDGGIVQKPGSFDIGQTGLVQGL